MAKFDLNESLKQKMNAMQNEDDADVFYNTPEEQTDSLDEESMQDLRDEPNEADEYSDDFLEDDEDGYYDDEGEEEYQKKQGVFSKINSSINMSNKAKTISLVAIVVVIAVVLITNPFSSKAEEEGSGGNFFSNIFGKSENDILATEEEAKAEKYKDNPELEIMDELKSTYPDYEITQDKKNKLFTVAGDTEDGKHTLIYKYDGELIKEDVDGEILFEDGVTKLPEFEQNGEAKKDGTEKGDEKEEEKVVLQEDSMIIKKIDYFKSILSLEEQKIDESAAEAETLDENGDPIDVDDPLETTSQERLIVEYERLPLKGKMPYLFCKVIDTDERLIFPIKLEKYMEMDDKGTTIVEVTVKRQFGVTTYEEATLIDWKDK